MSDIIRESITTLKTVSGMAGLLELAETKEEMLQVLQCMTDELESAIVAVNDEIERRNPSDGDEPW